MANLTFRTISNPSRHLGEAAASGADQFDLALTFEIGASVENLIGITLPSLLVFAAKRVNFSTNFITVNAPLNVMSQSYEDAKDEDYFVGNILTNPSETWMLQIVRIAAGKLYPGTNTLRIHSRNEDGIASGNRDNFSVARLFLFYFGTP
jgi:hypothetical protein